MHDQVKCRFGHPLKISPMTFKATNCSFSVGLIILFSAHESSGDSFMLFYEPFHSLNTVKCSSSTQKNLLVNLRLTRSQDLVSILDNSVMTSASEALSEEYILWSKKSNNFLEQLSGKWNLNLLFLMNYILHCLNFQYIFHILEGDRTQFR